ncbi:MULTISPECIES: class I SAM-dependent methyltransferase [Streptomyces]|uniref:Class I SAM-dependent methyltransferase n=1 Tax=Streptomyces dengpaensis TaxID=2049881 RepID=A0ABN5I7P7_9ACTN|nr:MULTISPECIES: class I SAM-dependent methyltransferase [Streptomyces]AVH59163.1 class I SAM-dependent methyltransferase [Streptomyces dengpaensis]PIB08659.1 methyltransferase [Streptomyces sp. HG99]
MTPAPQSIAERRAAYAAELAQGTDRFHEPRRADCPWCGSLWLRTRLRTPDLVQGKPGTFTVDECGDCAHAFQNPRLTAEGLAFYQRDLRGGVHEGLVERLLGVRGSRGRHRVAARAMLPYGEPESWLDVGTGHGHFPAAARDVHPYTAFDGLDPTRRVEEARAAGRVEEAHRGRLTDPRITARLRARYDVVSMFHHLEHSPDPRDELRAALVVLRPGGHLLVEVPDPDCAFGVLLGKWWVSYGQPRHLHLMPLPNLLDELESLGCEIVATDRREPHIPYDLVGALALAIGRVLPDLDAPWCAAPATARRRTLHTALSRASVPLLASAAGLDHALAPLLRRTRFSNAYRIVARR